MNKNLFRANTIPQFKIGAWLATQGIAHEDIATVELLAADTVRISNPAGQYMTLRIDSSGNVTIDGGEDRL